MSNDRTWAPIWVEPLCRIALLYRTGELSIRDLFQQAAPDLEDPTFIEIVSEQLEREAELVAAWQQYSHDKRGTPSPYLEGNEVGFVEVSGGEVWTRGVRRFETARDACSAFILREAAWVLHRREIA
jgi:hypothetical protein